MKHADDPLYDRNKELLELLWAQERMNEDMREEMVALLELLKTIRHLNSMGKTKQIADLIENKLK
jgi:hypothetical protein